MKKLLYIALIGSAWLGTSKVAMAQCPTSIALSTRNITAASCPSSGSITIGSNCAVGSLQYFITTGPTGAPLNIPQNDSTFRALPAGAYTVKAVCAANPGVSATVDFTIANAYTAMGNPVIATTSSCNNDGTITVNSVTGGSLPLQYSAILNSNPNYPDNLSVYQTTGNFTGLAAGTYIVRVKDACNEFRNSTIEILPPLPAVTLQMASINNQPCANNQYEVQIYGAQNAAGGNVDIAPYLASGGITINVYASDASCTKGTFITTFNYTSASNNNFLLNKIATHQYYVEATTACGITTHFCIDGGAPQISFQATTAGCGGSAVMGIMSIYEYQTLYPLTVTVINSLGNNIAGSPFTFSSRADMSAALSNLSPDNYHITVVDQCGLTIDDEVIQNITLSGAPTAGTISTSMNCNTQTGTTGVAVNINGYVANLRNVDSIKIISGPSNVGVNGIPQPGGGPIFGWLNMLPGNYVLRVYTSCGTTDINYKLTSATTLKRKIQIVGTNYCGGTGKVAIKTTGGSTTYNGAGTASYVLINNTTNARLDSNITGVFTNLNAGDYRINMMISGYCDDDGMYEVASNVVTINDAGSPAAITKKLGMICEDASGNVLATGSAYLELTGASPLVLEYKKSTDATWTTYSSNAAATVTITGLTPYTIYDFRLSSCTASATTQVSIGKLSPLSVSNTVQPCTGSPYTLSVPPMPGASYSWKNPAGVVVSTTGDYSILSYNASYDGVYTCTVTFSGCVTRLVSVNLNATMCSQPLPIKLTSFTAVNKDCKQVLSWTAVYHNTDKEFVVERSNNGNDFTAIATIPVKQANGQYSYTDIADNSNGNIYYRLKMTDVDGTFQYSNTQVVKACQDGKYTENAFVILPNPAASGQNVNLVYSGAKISGYYNIINTTGQIVQHSSLQTIGADAGNMLNISLRALTPGIYLVSFVTDEGKIIGHEKLVVY